MDEFKSRVMAATDIVNLIGRTVSLKKRGRDHVGLCPFHSEKTPSFHVNQERQFYYCYGCKAAGDAINFVKQRDRVEFMDALKSLAQDAGIPVPQFGGRREDQSQTQVVLEANSSATMFFEGGLADPVRGKAARDYLQSRGITPETAKKFRIGFAADGWDNLLRGPVGQKFRPEQLQLAGLVKQRDPDRGTGYYDTFRNRLMFPIRDPNGRVIAFGGRVMPGAPSDIAKYLNSPETPLFSKSRCLYGLDQARQRIVETQTAVIVEGYTDVVMAHQFGAGNAVAALGTALTEQHVGLLRRFAQRIVLLFDPDTAGEAAVDRAVSLFLTQPVEIAIATFGEDLDPDEYLLKYGLEAWEKLIAAAPEALAFKWKQLVKRFAADEGNNLTGQQSAIEAYLDLISQARAAGPVDPIRWGLVLSQVGKLTGIPTEQLHKRLSMARPGPKSGPATAVTQKNVPPPPVQREQRARRGVLSARDRAECWILGVLLLEPARWQRVQLVIGPDDFTDDRRRRLAEVYWNYQRDEGEPVFNELLSLLGDSPATGSEPAVSNSDLRELAIEVTDEVEGFAERETDFEATLSAAIGHLQLNRQSQEKQKLIASLRRNNDQGLGAEQEVDLLQRLQDQVRQASSKRPMF